MARKTMLIEVIKKSDILDIINEVLNSCSTDLEDFKSKNYMYEFMENDSELSFLPLTVSTQSKRHISIRYNGIKLDGYIDNIDAIVNEFNETFL